MELNEIVKILKIDLKLTSISSHDIISLTTSILPKANAVSNGA